MKGMLGHLAGLRRKGAFKGGKGKGKAGKVMGEFKRGNLRSGSKTGPKVKKRKQAVAIAMSESRKAASGGY
jgi:hypothetical protein